MAVARQPLRIAEIVSGAGVNGAATHCLALTRALSRRGHDTLLICRPRSWMDVHASTDLDVVRSDLHRWPPDELRRVARLLRDRRIDVIHTHSSRAHFFGVLVRRFAAIPVVATAHSRRLQAHWMLNDHVIAVAGAVRRFQRWNLVRSSRITVVHQFVDADTFFPADDEGRRASRAAIGIDPSMALVGSVGSVFREKGLQDLVAAWPAVVAAVAHAHLVIVGDGPPAFVRELRTALEAQRVPRHVTWLGRRDDVPRIMRALDVLALPSHDEAAPAVALEAMASGVPVVATRVGGVPEYVADGHTGSLVGRGNVKELSDALTRLLTDTTVRIDYGRRARERVLEQFSLPVQVTKIEHVFERVLGSARL